MRIAGRLLVVGQAEAGLIGPGIADNLRLIKLQDQSFCITITFTTISLKRLGWGLSLFSSLHRARYSAIRRQPCVKHKHDPT